MKMLKNYMCIAQCLEKHPILSESQTYKIKYLNVLEYFLRKYQPENKFSVAMLNLYKEKFLGKNFKNYSYDETKIKSVIRSVSSIKFVWFKFYTYRFVLMLDCMLLVSFYDISLSKKIFADINVLLKSWIMDSIYSSKMEYLFDMLYQNQSSTEKIDFVNYHLLGWQKNRTYYEKKPLRLLVTANMSAGKSTLINALIGKNVTKTKNDACTAKLHFIQSKAFEDGFDYEDDYKLELNADRFTLMDDNIENKLNEISVGTFFRLSDGSNHKICLIDTPGVNFALDCNQKTLTEAAVKIGMFDKILYVFNGENIGTDDDYKYMNFLVDNVKNKKVIFVLNKLDRYIVQEDDIAETIQKLNDWIHTMGFNNYVVCPISAYAGLLGKKKLFNDALDEDEEDELGAFVRKFKKKDYDLSQFYAPDKVIAAKKIISLESNNDRKKYLSLLNNAGMLALENILFDDREEI